MRIILSIFFLCASTFIANAIEVNFRAAGVDVDSQKYFLQWDYPNIGDTALIKNIAILRYKADAVLKHKMDTIDLVSPTDTYYIDDNSTCCNSSIYMIRFVPKDGNNHDSEDPFRTMQLHNSEVDSCAYTINLSWSPYEKIDRFSIYDGNPPIALPNFKNEVSYHIYGHIGSTFNPDSVQWLGASGSDTTFALPITQEQKHYHLYIAAIYNNSKDTSYSNRISVYADVAVRPKTISIDSVLSNENSTKLHFTIDQNTEYSQFWVEKSSNADGAFSKFAEINKFENTAIDNSAESKISYYRVSAVNGCNRAISSSPIATSLAVNVQSKGTDYEVSWNDIGYNNDIVGYSVYRTLPTEIAGLVGQTGATSIVDNQLPDSVLGYDICYRVEASGIGVNHYARSAEACNATTPEAYMPNAIQLSSNTINAATGNSRNLFAPVSNFKMVYALTVYSRDGKQVYHGNEAWNGRKNNSEDFVSQGSYIYLIKITFANGAQTEKRGTVTVVY